MAKISGPYVVPDDHVALIGRVANLWSQIEFEIDKGIWHLADTHQQLAACITSQFMSIHPRLNAFKGLVQVRGGSEQAVKEIDTFHGNIGSLVDRRNRIVHDPRFIQGDTRQVQRLEVTSRGKKVQFGFLPEERADLERTLVQIRERGMEFIALRDRIISEIEAIPPESLPILLEIVPAR
jgi:hypothetical protein